MSEHNPTALLSRFEFESTLDELIPIGLLISSQTAAYRRGRSQSQWAFGVSLVVFLLLAVFSQVEGLTAFVWSALIGFALMLGLVLGLVYGRVYDASVRRQYRRMILELYGGATTIHSVIEVRADKVWVKQNDVELTLPWHRSTKIEDTADAVLLWFEQQNLVRLPNRVFASAEDRRSLLESSRELRANALSLPKH